jgi:arylsulfatase A-like enzyme
MGGKMPKDGEEESYNIAGVKQDGDKDAVYNRFRRKQLRGKLYDYKAPNEYEAVYREENKYSGAPRKDIKRRDNVDKNDPIFYDAAPGYFGAVNSLDDKIGDMIRYLERENDPRNPGKKLIDNTVIVFTADHGELLRSHRLIAKGPFYEESSGVPLIFYWKDKIVKNIRKKALFNSIDVMPTILGLLNIKLTTKIDGRNRSPELFTTDTNYDEEYLIGEGVGYTKRYRKVRYKNFIYVYGPEVSTTECVLFDLDKDPFQMNPIRKGEKDSYDKIISRLHLVLQNHLKEYNDPFELPG